MFNNILFYPIVFLFGLAIGSFLNCVIYRLEKEEGFLKGRSYCPHCRHQLSWRDLIPLLSFLILKGKCRYCQNKISWQYPLVELSTGILFLLPLIVRDPISNTFSPLFVMNSFTMVNLFAIFYYFVMSCFLLIIFVYDLKHYIIPDKIIYPAIIISFFYQFFEILEFRIWNLFRISDLGFGILRPILNPLFSAILASTFFLTIVLFSRGKWMGTGDIKLAFLMGLFLSFPNILVALFLAFFLGAIIGIGLIISGKKTLKSEVPFGPFLVTGTFISFFWGQKIINWYLSFFL